MAHPSTRSWFWPTDPRNARGHGDLGGSKSLADSSSSRCLDSGGNTTPNSDAKRCFDADTLSQTRPSTTRPGELHCAIHLSAFPRTCGRGGTNLAVADQESSSLRPAGSYPLPITDRLASSYVREAPRGFESAWSR